MSEPVELQINPAKPSEIEFSVDIQGVKTDDHVDVRFVINSDDMSLLFPCVSSGDQWTVKFPILSKILTAAEYSFNLEVIIDGYFFVPAEGKIAFISKPVANLDKKAKPAVKASFSVRQTEDVEVDTDALEERVSGAGDISDMSAPTTANLRPEFSPDADENEGNGVTFNPHDVADTIIKNTLGDIKSPSKKGFLFNRKGDKAVVSGLEDAATKADMQSKQAAVRKILSAD